MDRQVLDEQVWHLRPEGVVDVPDLQVADDERVPGVRADAVDALAEVHPVEPVAGVHLVVLEPDERQRSDVGRLAGAVGLADREDELQGAARGGLVAEPVPVALGGHVAGERVEAARPPEPGPLVLVERQDLLGQPLRGGRPDGEVAVEHVVHLGAVFEEEPVPGAPVADVVTDDEVVGAVDREPAVAAVPDRVADRRAAAHRVTAEVVVQGVAAEHARLAEVAELGVPERAGRAVVVHRVAADARRVGALDDHVAGEVRHLAAVVAVAEVRHRQRPVERQPGPVDRGDRPLLGGRSRLGGALGLGPGEDDPVAGLPPGHRLGE